MATLSKGKKTALILTPIVILLVIIGYYYNVKGGAQTTRDRYRASKDATVAVQPIAKATPPKRTLLPDAPVAGSQKEDTMTREALPGILPPTEAKQQKDELPIGEAPQQPTVPIALLNQQLPMVTQEQARPTELPRVEILPERFLFNNLSTDAVSGGALMLSNNSESANRNKRTYAPAGESITLIIKSSASTRDAEIPIVAMVWEPLIFNGNVVLEMGTKIVGYAQPGKIQNRATVKFEKIIFKDGTSVPIDALGTTMQGDLGVPGIQVGNYVADALTPVLLELASAGMSAFQQGAQSVITNTGGGALNAGSTMIQNTQQDVGKNLGNAAASAGTSALQKLSSILAQEMEENRPYLLVQQGTPCKALLVTGLDTSKRD